MDHKPVLIFDGECGFCTTVANHLKNRARSDFEIAAWQLTALKPFELSSSETSERVYLVCQGKKYAGAKAVAKSLTLMKPLSYRVLGKLISVPPLSWLAIPGYLLVAKFRHRLPGGTPACKL